MNYVLIETYWNVKVESLRVFPALEVLIETYWNVKFSAAISFSDVVCINRNILECKEESGSRTSKRSKY